MTYIAQSTDPDFQTAFCRLQNTSFQVLKKYYDKTDYNSVNTQTLRTAQQTLLLFQGDLSFEDPSEK